MREDKPMVQRRDRRDRPDRPASRRGFPLYAGPLCVVLWARAFQSGAWRSWPW